MPATAADSRLKTLGLEIKLAYFDWNWDNQPHNDRGGFIDLYFATEKDGAVYYVSSSSGTYAQFKETAGSITLTLIDTDTKTMLSGVLPHGLRAPMKLSATRLHKARFLEDSSSQWSLEVAGYQQRYWADYEALDTIEKTPEIIFISDLQDRTFGSLGHGSKKVTGTLEFDPCDGCEHGDWLLVKAENDGPRKVDVLPLDIWKNYYTADCPGTPHPWLVQLMKLRVPVTYLGNVTHLDMKLWGGEKWTALSGKITLGSSEKIELVPFLDSLAGKNGRFISYVGEVLVFEYSGLSVAANLRTGEILRP